MCTQHDLQNGCAGLMNLQADAYDGAAAAAGDKFSISLAVAITAAAVTPCDSWCFYVKLPTFARSHSLPLAYLNKITQTMYTHKKRCVTHIACCKINYYPYYIFRLAFISSSTQQVLPLPLPSSLRRDGGGSKLLLFHVNLKCCCSLVFFITPLSFILTSGAIDSPQTWKQFTLRESQTDGYTLQN